MVPYSVCFGVRDGYSYSEEPPFRVLGVFHSCVLGDDFVQEVSDSSYANSILHRGGLSQGFLVGVVVLGPYYHDPVHPRLIAKVCFDGW